MSSNDVYLSYNDASVSSLEEAALKEPFVDVSVKPPNSLPPLVPAHPSLHFAPNPFLFRLGVMLLELTFEAPLGSMQKPIDREGGLEDRHAEFFTAKRLGRVVSSAMGSRYAEIVRKCLQCNFGRGDDLSDPELQGAIYREVACELGQLEEGFRRLNIAT